MWVLVGEGRDKLELWRTANWERGPSLPRHLQNPYNAVAFSPDGRLLAIREANQVSLINTTTGTVVSNLTLPTDSDHSVDVCFVGADRLAAIFLDGSVLIWNLSELRKELSAMGLDWVETSQ